MRHVHRLAAWQRRLLYGSGLVLLATGVVWLALHYGRGADALPSPLEANAMQLHGLAAFVALFVLGALAAQHIPNGWRLSHRMRWAQQRGSGLALCAFFAALALTGYLLYYFAPETVRPALGWLHSALGIAASLLVLGHRRRSTRLPARAAASAAAQIATDRTPEGPAAEGNVVRRGRK
jgi:hypothetical protein